jgi:hypothetical protein
MPKLRNMETVSAATATPALIAASQSLAGAGPLTLTGAALPAAQPITITSAGNDSTLTWTLTGTDYGGSPVTETLAGGNAAAVTSANSYASITSLVGSKATASTVTAGTAATQYGPWLIVGAQRNEFNYQVRTFIGTTAAPSTATYDVQATSDINIMNNTGGYADDIVTLASAQTGNLSSYPNAPWMAYRLRVTAGGPVTLRILENRTA